MERMFCGVDIGGTKLAAGLMDSTGRLVHSFETSDHICLDEECVMDLIRDTVINLCRDAEMPVSDLAGVGVGMAGHIRSREGIVITTSNLPGFKNYPLARELSARLEIRVAVDNDANCQALAEHRFGAGQGHDDMIFITVSTGIGAGIIINNRLLRGQTGTAGEIGHTIIEPSSESLCTCGNKGCFMAHACTLNLDSLVKRKSARHTTSKIAGSTTRSGTDRIDGKVIHEHACHADPLALEVIDEYADYLGIMIYNLFQIFNPPTIVMGGGLMNWGDAFFNRITSRFYSLARDMLFDPIAIVKAELGKGSGVRGAACLLFDD